MRIIHSLKYVFEVFLFSLLQKKVLSFIYGSVSDKFSIKQCASLITCFGRGVSSRVMAELPLIL